MQRREVATSSDQRIVVVREPVSPDGHVDTVLFVYLPGPSGQGMLLHNGSTVGVRGIKL
jgi:hypothetical protein